MHEFRLLAQAVLKFVGRQRQMPPGKAGHTQQPLLEECHCQTLPRPSLPARAEDKILTRTNSILRSIRRAGRRYDQE